MEKSFLNGGGPRRVVWGSTRREQIQIQSPILSTPLHSVEEEEEEDIGGFRVAIIKNLNVL